MTHAPLDYSLYLVTDRDLMSTATLEQALVEACEGGVSLIQLREKHAIHDEFLELARKAKRICARYGVSFIINDDVRLALEVGADGVHVGQQDTSAARARSLLGPDAIVGVSVSNCEEATAAEAAGADYLGVGAMFATNTKTDAQITSPEELRRILAAVKIPCVLIGGINARTIPQFAQLPVAGYAVVSAIIAAPDIYAAAHDLRVLIDAQMPCCHVITNGPGTPCAQLVRKGDVVIAADAGYLKARACGIKAQILVSDFDSMPKEQFQDSSCELIQLPVAKDDTDTLVALREGLKRGWRRFVIHCACGNDMGHTLANLHCLRFLDEHYARGFLLNGKQRVYLLSEKNPQLVLSKPLRTRISVFAFGGAARGVYERGTRWELEDAQLKPGESIGVANYTTELRCRIRVGHGELVVCVG